MHERFIGILFVEISLTESISSEFFLSNPPGPLKYHSINSPYLLMALPIFLPPLSDVVDYLGY
jgi:hypothetical protein